MANKLDGKKVAILVTDGFEQVELTEPKKALEEAGAQTHIIAPKGGEVKGWNHTDWGDTLKVDKQLNSVNADEYHALLLPGGVMNPDKLRGDKDVVAFVSKFMEAGKPVAAICHGPWTLIETGKVKGKKMTSYHTLKTDLKNAGADWVDEEVVVDNGLVTSRNPDDIPAFNKKMIEEIAEGRHDR
ncbi:type 1 glutamine amidotransferase domain-containing protein [Pontibacter roseus]|uniref:type 1 glutamine amidotransferase domain-containing protein n=1 Tax=Pontibacter roseus TaxID=336989 RepID=UPI000379F8C7|nr:type 1 glutamine amidotransferase domain-containing protein [Pontibacter roseus]